MPKYFYCLLLICASSKAISQTTDERLRKDWANIKKYENKNSNASSGKVIYMGDSITEFWFYSDSLFFDANGYINRG